MAVVVVGVVVGVGVVVRRVVMGEVLGTTNGNMVYVFTAISTMLDMQRRKCGMSTYIKRF